MTCVITTATPPWQPYNAGYDWALMNPAPGSSTPSYADKTQYGYASSDTDSRKTAGGSSKKRASRAGTRSVSTLSAAQLERKRANDREAQRAIRQRTKDHIDGLERTVSELRHSNEANENMVVMTQRRNRELEEEVGYLRSKLGETGYHLNVHPPEQPSQQTMPAHTASPATSSAPVGVPLSESDPNSRSLSLATSHSSASRAGSWQQGPSGYQAPTSNPPPGVAMSNAVPIGHNLTTWRSHDSTTSVHTTPAPMQHPAMQSQPQTPYATSNPNERAQWPTQTPTYSYQEQPRPQQYEVPPPQTQQQSQQPPQPQYPQPPVQPYNTSPAPSQPHSYPPAPPPPPPPQTEFQGMQVSSPAAYQVPPPQAFAPPAQYPMQPMQGATSSPEYAAQQGHMQPPPVPQPTYQTGPDGQQYATQQVHPPMQFSDDSGHRAYSMTHYPSG